MKNFLLIFVIITITNVCVSGVGIYTQDGQVREIKAKIRGNEWAAANYEALKSSVEPYVERHKKDPQWIVSRLQMYWNNKYKDVYVNGSVFSHGEGLAPVPTPKFAGGRDWAVDYLNPDIEDIKPYMDDEKGLWLQNGKKEGNPWEWAPVDKTGQIIERINERVMTLAQNAAFVYWLTGDEDYAKFAADIFWTYTNGMYHRENPKFYEDDRSRQIVGLATFEVIHEAITVPMAVCYDYIREYLKSEGKDTDIAEAVFCRWADRIIEGGGAKGNWNINQARYIVYMALALESNDKYANGKGRQYYLDSFLKTSREFQKALPEVVNDEYDPDQAIWPEAPGYAFGTTQTIIKLATVIRNAVGQDILKDFPIIERAYLAYFQYLFPNGYSVGFGDTYHDKPETEPVELLIALYRYRGDKEMEAVVTNVLKDQMTQGYDRSKNNTLFTLANYVGDLTEANGSGSSLQTPTYYSRPVNMFIQRSGEDPQTALCAALTGTAGGHVHANGMTMELYGRGMVMGPDCGRGSSYWQSEHGQYYSRYPAHNTVIVDGISDYDPHHGQHGDKRYAAYRVNSWEPVPESTSRINENISFIDASFTEPKTGAVQRRLLALIRTSSQSGFYVDMFRSARSDGADKFHDYVYHNIGKLSEINDSNGRPVALNKTNLLNSQRGLLKGYDYFTDEYAAKYNGDLNVIFEVSENAAMKMWAAGYEDTTVFKVTSPRSRAALRGSIPSFLAGKPMPAVIVRRSGAAWKRPFINIFEPFDLKKGTFVRDIRNISVESLAALEIETADGKIYVMSSESDYKRFKINDMEFEGNFAVVSIDSKGKVKYLYLGNGRYLNAGSYSIDSCEQLTDAGLEIDGNNRIKAKSHDSVRIAFPVKDKKATVKNMDFENMKPQYTEKDGITELSVRLAASSDIVVEIVNK